MTSVGTLVGGAGPHNGWLRSLALATVGVLVGGVNLPCGQLEGLASTVGVPVGGAGPSETAEVALEGPNLAQSVAMNIKSIFRLIL